MLNQMLLNTIKSILAADEGVVSIKRTLFDMALILARVPVAQAGSFPSRFRVQVPVSGVMLGGMLERESYAIDGRITNSKIYAIKYIRAVSGMGLKEAKEYVESLPLIVAGGELR